MMNLFVLNIIPFYLFINICFKEFDEFDEFEETHHEKGSSYEHKNIDPVNTKSKSSKIVDFDEDEFEGIDDIIETHKDKEVEKAVEEEVEARHPVRNNYYMEIGFISFLVLYIINYFIGSSKNKQIATAWYLA